MKRRNADCGKIRRPIKRNKIAEGMYGSTTILYMKFLILWAIVITADFMFMFRFEFLWPFWLLLRSVHDSFKYKGLAFSVLFVCIAITSDLVCLFFIPVHWLLFAASTYVWVQYVWHTDKGICLPTIILWMLFVYLEAGIRWKDSRHMPHLDLCRPFAAHCIGYPVVTLGFGFKSYVGYRMRQRKQREVAKENEFYMQLLQQALPQDEALDDLQNISANGSVVVSTVSSTSGSTTGPGSAQTVHANSIAADHHSSSHHGDDKNHIGHLNSSQVTAIQHTASLPNNHHHQHHHHNNFNNSSSGSSNRNAQTNSKINHVSNSVTTATANGHVGNSLNSSMTAVSSSKSQRRSADKDKNDSNQHHSSNSSNLHLSTNKSANSNHVSNNSHSADSGTHNGNSSNTLKLSATSNSSYLNHVSPSQSSQKESKDKDSWDNCSSSTTSSASSNSSVHSSKDGKVYPNNYEMTNGNHSSFPSSGPDKKNQPNGNIAHYEVEEVAPEPVEKVKGRRNRSKRDTQGSSKDNHSNHNTNNTSQQQHQNNHSHNNSQQNHSQQQHKDSTTSLDSITSSSSSLSSTAAAAAATISNVASQIVSKVCETCLRLETEIKKYRNEISHMKQIENELRQKLESNAINKSCLQAKQRENDEMEKRLQELQSCRQTDFINLQNAERRLTEERRQRQSLESLLNNEKKARKLAEEKANRAECSEQCKQRKMQIEQENKQLRRELKSNEEAKQVAEQQGRKFEQELRMFEAEIRNREAQQGTEVLMSALAAMQDKNSTLEKNLSAETRVKLDLFSALGEAKRQLEIKDSMVRNKDEEVLDLKAKIAQLLAVMPTDSLCLPQCSNTGSSMLRMNDTPPLQGPSSPIMSLGGPTHQLMAAAAAAAHQQQMNSRGGSGMVSNVVTVVTSASGVTNVVSSSGNGNNNSNVLTQTSSNLDPNATAYTPKNSSLVGGAEA